MSCREITHVSRDRGSEYASAASRGAPQAVQVADRFHVAKNLAEAVQDLLARVLTELKANLEGEVAVAPAQGEVRVPVEEWRPAPGKQVKRTISTHRAEREARYQQVKDFQKQGLTSKEIAHRLGVSERTVRHCLKRGVAPDVRPRRKRRSDFDPYAPYMLKRWEEGERNGTHLWQEIAAASGMRAPSGWYTRFLKTLKTHEIEASVTGQRPPHYSSTAAVSLFMGHPDKLEELEQEHLTAFRRTAPSLEKTYQLVQDFLTMMRQRDGELLDAWLLRVHESQLPELESFAHGIERDKDAVQAGLTLAINNGQVEGQVTRIKLIKRMMYGKAGFALLRQRVLHRI